MADIQIKTSHDFKGISYSKLGHFKEVQSKIKELEKLNLELAHRHNRLEAIFNSMSDGLTILDRNFTIVSANQVQKNMFPDISMIGKKCFKAFFRQEKICHECPVLRSLETLETFQGETLVKSGAYAGRYYEWTTSPIKGPNEKVDEIILLMRDITLRKESEHKLMQADRMATIGFLAAGIAHEINNPLASIAGFAEGLLKRLKNVPTTLDDKMFRSFQEYLEIIQSEAYRCKDIIQNLQEFSRSSSEDFEPIPIDRVIRDTISLFRQHAKDKGIAIKYENHLSSGLGTLSGKESQLRHLFLNLFNRAFNATEKGDALSLVSMNQGNDIEISMRYNGGGTVGDFPGSIFNPARSQGVIGEPHTIDLSICYSIVNHHKGEIKLMPDGDNISSRFIIRFPVSLPRSQHLK
jgi:two-component system, NtrC family, sensor kinase